MFNKNNDNNTAGIFMTSSIMRQLKLAIHLRYKIVAALQPLLQTSKSNKERT